jgi:hypothetical protein
MTEQNLKAFFQLSIDESIDLGLISVVNKPTAKQFQDCLPKAYEPNKTFSDGTYFMDVYFAFDRVYGIDSDGYAYCVAGLDEIKEIYDNKIDEYEMEIEQTKEDEKDLFEYLKNL